MPRLTFKTPFHPFHRLKKILPKSLFGRSLIILMTPLILVQVILSYIFFERHTDAVLDLLAESIVGDVLMVVDRIDRGGKIQDIQESAKTNFKFDVTLDPRGQIKRFGIYRDQWLYPYMTEHLNRKLNYLYFLRMTSSTIQIEIPHERGLLGIEMPRKRLYSRTTPYVILWTAVSAILLFGVASLFMKNQIRPIRRLADAAERFGKGEQNVLFKPEGASEVRTAGMAFIDMRSRLNKHMQERIEMLAGVSHDLRTPLTRMKLQLAMMPQSEEIRNLANDVDQMQHMVQGFLDFSRGVGDSDCRDKTAEVDIKGFFDTVIYDLRHAQLRIHRDCPEGASWKIKPNLMGRCLINLLSNSEKYAHNAWIAVGIDGREVTLTLDDDGPGIPETEWKNVFRPFYRLDEARNLDSGGVGLGMSIARDIIHHHGGSLSLENSPRGGLRVNIVVPR
jgi:two-component system osmolarity sensor histidine kinase EnvZ